MVNNLYYFNKNTNRRYLLGEIQSDFNFSFVIDGTKDSAKVIVLNFSGAEIEPNTICWHENTDTWWIVTNDKVERYLNEGGYCYKHNIQLLGAIELLNARDLTTSGFNANRYTIGTFFARLLKHSTFEFKNNYVLNTNTLLSADTIVDYVKTFENYTLLSAIREFFDSYNCSIKLSFVQTTASNITTITSCVFDIVSKVGDTTQTILDVSTFNNVKETKILSVDSFGTTIVSNADNVISAKSKTFPSAGYRSLSSNEHEVTNENAILRLPSNAFKVNWAKLFSRISITIKYEDTQGGDRTVARWLDIPNINIINSKLAVIFQKLVLVPTEFLDFLNDNINEISENCLLAMTTTFYYNDNYNPNTKTFVDRTDIYDYYAPIIKVKRNNTEQYNGAVVLTNKEMHNSTENEYQSLYFERGKDYLSGFNFLSADEDPRNQSFVVGENSTDLGNKTKKWAITLEGDTQESYIEIVIGASESLLPKRSYWQVNYIPMSDLKIKYDNSSTGEDIQLFNQTGKLTDSFAFSKRLLSFSKEIETDNITKYGCFYSYDSVPKVGRLVNIGNVDYVINSVSIDFIDNEDGYFLECEFTLSKNIAVKSLMVNPNTNIRDYGIPQSNNVVRKQMYRDFYELSHTPQSGSSLYNSYLELGDVLNLSFSYANYVEHSAIIKITYNEAINNLTSYYYQLETTTFALKKSIYEVVDFKDNNIIGYDTMNVFSGFDIRKILSGLNTNVNTPISYVDNIGEFKSIQLAFCTTNRVLELCDYYEKSKALEYGITPVDTIAYKHCFIPAELYEGGTNFVGAVANNSFRISEINYNKDALEVPFFEYSCQIDDSDDVIVGDNVLDFFNEYDKYIYTYIIVDKNTINNNNYKNLNIERVVDTTGSMTSMPHAKVHNGVSFSYTDTTYVNIALYSVLEINTENDQLIQGTRVNISNLNLTDKDIVIIRHRMTKDTYRSRYKKIREEYEGSIQTLMVTTDDLMFVIKDTDGIVIGNNKILLRINHYKLN